VARHSHAVAVVLAVVVVTVLRSDDVDASRLTTADASVGAVLQAVLLPITAVLTGAAVVVLGAVLYAVRLLR
jgi:hypothetical protein